MVFDTEYGQELAKKYLGTDSLKTRLEHTNGVAEFAYKVAQKIKTENPELEDLDPEFVRFLGYVHDIGYSVDAGKHEVHTIDLLINQEGVPAEVAKKAMHGQLVEQFGEKEGNAKQYLPVGLDGMILTYADMSVRTGGPIPIRDRAKEIIERIQGIPNMPPELKKDITNNMYKALPRFERYEKIVLSLAGVNSAEEF